MDLILISVFLALSPAVKEAAVVRSDSKKDLGVISVSSYCFIYERAALHSSVRSLNTFFLPQVFQQVLTKVQEEALMWMYSSVPKIFRPLKKEFLLCLNKVICFRNLILQN